MKKMRSKRGPEIGSNRPMESMRRRLRHISEYSSQVSQANPIEECMIDGA